MKIAKRDICTYNKFLNQLEKGFNNEMLDKYAIEIKYFIESSYEKETNELFELSDFIQEALILILKNTNSEKKGTFNKGLFKMQLKELYSKMKKDKNMHFVEKIECLDSYYEMNERQIFFELLLPSLFKYATNSNQKIILEEILNGSIQADISRVINRSRGRTNIIYTDLIRRIRNSEEFKDYYYDIKALIYTEYKRCILSFIDQFYPNNNYDYFINLYWKNRSKALNKNGLKKLSEFYNIFKDYCNTEGLTRYDDQINEDLKILKIKRGQL